MNFKDEGKFVFIQIYLQFYLNFYICKQECIYNKIIGNSGTYLMMIFLKSLLFWKGLYTDISLVLLLGSNFKNIKHNIAAGKANIEANIELVLNTR
ncbi:hypothetical protein [Clostridium sp. ZS2-4]|uniref:hypothetical protein n=1 Tax=Clostridium sp. ZS2-4 TaxID=2987703 RepID=UPI00227BA0AC|nr:hypothetical protein [Clostridium sp. ZS2-4]MCY6354777.1 hypothetical protein [Clostridium sp. ZS2-4]